jgi:hypothetical protein
MYHVNSIIIKLIIYLFLYLINLFNYSINHWFQIVLKVIIINFKIIMMIIIVFQLKLKIQTLINLIISIIKINFKISDFFHLIN